MSHPFATRYRNSLYSLLCTIWSRHLQIINNHRDTINERNTKESPPLRETVFEAERNRRKHYKFRLRTVARWFFRYSSCSNMVSHSPYGQLTGLRDVVADERALSTCQLKVLVECNDWDLSADCRAPSWSRKGIGSPPHHSHLGGSWVLHTEAGQHTYSTSIDHAYAVTTSTGVNAPEFRVLREQPNSGLTYANVEAAWPFGGIGIHATKPPGP